MKTLHEIMKPNRSFSANEIKVIRKAWNNYDLNDSPKRVRAGYIEGSTGEYGFSIHKVRSKKDKTKMVYEALGEYYNNNEKKSEDMFTGGAKQSEPFVGEDLKELAKMLKLIVEEIK